MFAIHNCGTVAEFIVPDGGDKVDSAQGCRIGPAAM